MVIRTARAFVLSAVAALLSAGPAHAQTGGILPEPSSTVLLGIGLAGLLIGRRFARKRRD